jgi:hypothetical protein
VRAPSFTGSLIGKVQALELVLQADGKFDGEKSVFKRGLVGFPDGHRVIVRTGFARAVKTPTQAEGVAHVAFENDPENILFVEKKLQEEMRMLDLIG